MLVASGTPATLGRYQIVKHLAQGGMADVLIARSIGIEGFERHVVIKRIRAEQARDILFVNMFLDEARLAAVLHHQNVVQVHDIGQEHGEYFFAMEYVHGEDLRALLRRVSGRKEQVPLEHVITIVAAAAAGLHHAHEQRGPDRSRLGIVHRDVSPSNILIGFDGGVKVVDFGIAKATMRSAETRVGTLKGKVAYMSPEQCTGRSVDRRADVFGLGIVLYELATARRLFKADNDFLIMASIVQGKIPPPSHRRPDLPSQLEAIILKALALAPEDRYATANELRLALEAFATTSGLSISTSRLGDYIKQLFGERVEPWLMDEEVEVDRAIDFDGAASGIVVPPDANQSFFAQPPVVSSESAPVVEATSEEITVTSQPAADPPPVVIAKAGWEKGHQTATALVRSPAAWAPEPPAAEARRGPARSSQRWWIIGGIGAAAVLLIVATSALSGQTNRDRVGPAESSPAPVRATVPSGTSADARVVQPTVVAPDAAIAEPAAPDAAVAERVMSRSKPNKPVRPRPRENPKQPEKPVKLDLDAPD